jgi:hypothetical protein
LATGRSSSCSTVFGKVCRELAIPRAVVILSATLAELALETALKYLLRSGKETDSLFDIDAPLGTFSATGEAARRMARSMANEA